MIKEIFFTSLLLSSVFTSSLLAKPDTSANSEVVKELENNEKPTKTTVEKKLEHHIQNKITALISEKNALDQSLKEDNIWAKIYSNYHTFQELREQKVVLDDQINILDNKYQRTESEEKAFEKLKSKRSIINGKLQLLREYEKNPFKKFLNPPEIIDVPRVGNPFEIISALNYIKHIELILKKYQMKFEELDEILNMLQHKKEILTKLNLDTQTIDKTIQDFKLAQDIYSSKL